MRKSTLAATIGGVGLLGLGAALTGVTHAANIAFISFHSSDAPSAAAEAAGLTSAADIGYTNLLTSGGHTVTRYATKDDPTGADADIYNAADLVVISRSISSSHYQQETAFWNTQITKPVITLGGYILRNSRLNFTDGGTMVDTTGDIMLMIGETSHPIFNGVTLGAGDTVDFASNVEEPLLGTPTQRGISINNNAAVNGTVLASVAGGPADGGLAIAEWQAGATLNNGDVLAGNRLTFLSGSREADGITSETAGLYDLTDAGGQMLLNATTYMAVPEPATGLLAVVGTALLAFRRRRS